MARAFAAVFMGLVLLAVAGAGGALLLLYHFGRGLPDYQQLAHYEPPTVTRVHAGDGSLLAEYAREKRVFVPVAAIPKRVVHAFLAAEDKTFYRHPGVDLPGILSMRDDLPAGDGQPLPGVPPDLLGGHRLDELPALPYAVARHCGGGARASIKAFKHLHVRSRCSLTRTATAPSPSAATLRFCGATPPFGTR